MRFLLVTNLFRPVTLGGYERGCAELADALTREGHDVHVLTTDLTDQPPGVADPQGLEVSRVLRSYRRLDGSFANGSLRWRMGVERWNLSTLRNRVAKLQPDAVMWWNLGGLNATLVEEGRRLGVPACGVVNDYWMEWTQDVDPWARAKNQVPLLGTAADVAFGMPKAVDYSAAAEWIFVSDYVRERAVAQVGPLARTTIVHSGIDLSTFASAALRPEWGRRLLYLGRVTKNKGIDLAIDALAALPDDTTLTVCGPRDVSLGAELEQQIDALGLGGRVTFREPVPAREVARLYATHDAVLFPGRWEEPWGKVPLEAMAAGAPVVTSATGGSVEYCRDRDNCLVARTPEEIAVAVQALEDDAELRNALAASGRLTAAQFATERADAGRRDVLLRIATAGAGSCF